MEEKKCCVSHSKALTSDELDMIDDLKSYYREVISEVLEYENYVLASMLIDSLYNLEMDLKRIMED